MSQEPTQEELRAYMEQLRSAPVEEVVAQAFSMLAAAAEAKLGETDARVLIDGIAGLTQGVGSRLGQLGAQMSQGVSQLQMAQVQLEKRDAASDGSTTAEQAGESGSAGAAGGAATSAPSKDDAAAARPAAGGGADQERMTDRLWVPGRGPRPPTG